MRWIRRSQGTPEDTPLTPQERRDEALSAYLDGELSAAEQAELEALLAADVDARETLEDLRTLSAALGNLGEVRAPRSFAIPAPAVTAPRGFSVSGGAMTTARVGSLFVRMEMAMRASAAAAALLFVMVAFNPTGSDTPTTGSFATPESAALAAGAEERSAAADGEAGVGIMGAPDSDAPQPEPGIVDGPGFGVGGGVSSPEDAYGSADDPELPVTSDPQRVDDGEPQDASLAPGIAGDTAAFAPPPSGTFETAAASESVGGVAPALATLAGLLAALSFLTAWTHRNSGSAVRE